MFKNFFKYLGILILSYSHVAVAESIYFIDHQQVAPGKFISVNYNIPAKNFFLECNQDSLASKLGSIEWTYKNFSFKGQIGQDHILALMREDMDSPNPSNNGFSQLADTTGKLIITNLDSTDLFVSCRYTTNLY
ncbi:MAG: hypothetical protein ABI597_00665 [Gammaproteobacteria bacterium]